MSIKQTKVKVHSILHRAGFDCKKLWVNAQGKGKAEFMGETWTVELVSGLADEVLVVPCLPYWNQGEIRVFGYDRPEFATKYAPLRKHYYRWCWEYEKFAKTILGVVENPSHQFEVAGNRYYIWGRTISPITRIEVGDTKAVVYTADGERFFALYEQCGDRMNIQVDPEDWG